MTLKLIINADDFGLCTGVNRAVAQAAKQGLLTSATLMANAPAAKEALEIAADLPALGLGIHLNLLEGKPLSNDPKVNVLVNDQGRFAFSPAKLTLLAALKTSFRNAIQIEAAAQIKWAFDNQITPTHLDSHKHLHAAPSIFPIITRLAENFNIPAVRWPFEPFYICSSTWPKTAPGGAKRSRIVAAMARINYAQNSKFIKNNIFLGIAHTGKIDLDFIKALTSCKIHGIAELMTHPAYPDGLDPAKTRLIEQRQDELKTLCSEKARELIYSADIELIHYGKL